MLQIMKMHKNWNAMNPNTFFTSLGLQITDSQQDKESAEYCGHFLTVNDKKIHYRVGKVTPTKIGQFVTFWKRKGDSPIMPYDEEDDFDYYFIVCQTSENLGCFVFPKQLLVQKDYVSVEGEGGKRGFRVYPSWDKAENSQAKKSQAWQLDHFYEGIQLDNIRTTMSKFVA